MVEWIINKQNTLVYDLIKSKFMMRKKLRSFTYGEEGGTAPPTKN